MNSGWDVPKPGDRVIVVSRNIDESRKAVVEEGIFKGLQHLGSNIYPGFVKRRSGFVVAFPHIAANGRGLDKDGALTLPFQKSEINPTLDELAAFNLRPRFRVVRRDSTNAPSASA